MKKLFTLGELYVSDFVKDGEQPRGGRHDLQLIMEDDTHAVRLETEVPLSQMFGKYFYRSGINDTMKKELKNIVDSILPLMKYDRNDLWCDCASNDGTLLSFVPSSFSTVGIDPAEDSYKIEAEKYADLIIQDFFSAQVFKKEFGDRKAKIITCIAMLYDVAKPDTFLRDIYEVLDDEGLFVVQLSHSGLMIKQCAFDNILSEHVYYYCLKSLKIYLERNGFKIVDCTLNETNGGSFRVYIRKQKADENLFASQAYRDVCEYRIAGLLALEEGLEMDNPKTWKRWFKEIQALKEKTVNFIKWKKSEGKTIWGYGASTKGNTLLQYFGLDNTLIDGIAERNKDKWGLKTIGTDIPIYSEEEMRIARPDYLLILPWHFVSEFTKREEQYLRMGGRFIVPCPSFKIIEK